MTPELKDDPIFELRLYQVAPGRMHDMEARFQHDLRTIFPNHGVRPLGGWSAVAGPAAPLFVYLTPFRHMQERTESWAGFAADPAWAECRARTNAGSELVERYDILLLRAIRPWAACPATAGNAPAIVEMLMQSVAVGQNAAVRKEILASTVPALESTGATVMGMFDVLIGDDLPGVVLFVSWNDMGQRADALARLDQDRRSTGVAGTLTLLGRADQYLMREVEVDWAPTKNA